MEKVVCRGMGIYFSKSGRNGGFLPNAAPDTPHGGHQSQCGLCQLPGMGVQRPGSSCLLGVWEESGNLPEGIWSGAGGGGRGMGLARACTLQCLPPNRPLDYPMHGCHRVVHNNLTGVQSALMLNHRW